MNSTEPGNTDKQNASDSNNDSRRALVPDYYPMGTVNVTGKDPESYDIGWWRKYWKRTNTKLNRHFSLYSEMET